MSEFGRGRKVGHLSGGWEELGVGRRWDLLLGEEYQRVM